MDVLRQDLLLALRLLRKDRAYAAAVILTLALCLGANAAIFTVVQSVLLRPLPYPAAERLVFSYDSFPGAGVERAGTSVPNYVDRSQRPDVFEQVALYRLRGLDVGERGAAERVTAQEVTPSLFRTLGAQALRGRLFSAADGEVGANHVVVVSHAYWQQQLGGANDAVGRDLRLNGERYAVVGIAPADFTFLDPGVRLWIPAAFTPEQRAEDARYSQNFESVARLAPGVSLVQAQAKLDALNARYLERAGPLRSALENTGYRTTIVPLEADLVRNVRASLRLLWGGVLFVLLIAAVNITNLALVRTSGRLRELATRHAIGAARTRVARQLLTETVLLTLIGGALGLAVGAWALGGLSWVGLDELPRGHEIRMDGTVILLTAGLAVLLGLVIGAVPVYHVAGLDINAVLREDSRTGTASRGARLTRRTLVVAQVAIAFVLLAGAGLLLSSFRQLLAVNPGFTSAQVMTGRVNPPTARYADDAALQAFAERALVSLRRLPGVRAAGITSNLPLSGDSSSSVVIAEGHAMAPGESVVSPNQLSVTPGYFEAMRVPLTRGRRFTDGDAAGAPRVAIVDEALARKFWPDADPIGRRMYLPQRPEDVVTPGPDVVWLQVVGVVGTVKLEGLVEGDGARVGAYYFPYAQSPSRGLGLAVRTEGDPVAITGAVRQALASLDPQLAFFDVVAMPERLERSLDNRRTPMLISVGFGAVALLLASVGIYGVLAYQVSQRTREIGIRMALGGSAAGVLRLVLREGTGLVVAGLAGGLVGAVALKQVIASELYGVGAFDPIVLLAVTGLLGLTSLIACLGPARRAAKVNPLVALSQQ
ncbi:MAG: ABC transporter permease [Vicinamibacteria bacterium]|nr:ABC transporter permease [Vicinamibacteria bacterium]